MQKHFLTKYIQYILLFMNRMFENSKYVILHMNGKQYINLDYEIYNQKYKYRLRINDEPIIFRQIKIFNECEEDISTEILEYAGPYYDFHGLKFTPKDFGHKEMYMYEDNEFIKRYLETENIIL